jgi:TAL effector repeat
MKFPSVHLTTQPSSSPPLERQNTAQPLPQELVGPVSNQPQARTKSTSTANAVRNKLLREQGPPAKRKRSDQRLPGDGAQSVRRQVAPADINQLLDDKALQALMKDERQAANTQSHWDEQAWVDIDPDPTRDPFDPQGGLAPNEPALPGRMSDAAHTPKAKSPWDEAWDDNIDPSQMLDPFDDPSELGEPLFVDTAPVAQALGAAGPAKQADVVEVVAAVPKQPAGRRRPADFDYPGLAGPNAQMLIARLKNLGYPKVQALPIVAAGNSLEVIECHEALTHHGFKCQDIFQLSYRPGLLIYLAKHLPDFKRMGLRNEDIVKISKKQKNALEILKAWSGHANYLQVPPLSFKTPQLVEIATQGGKTALSQLVLIGPRLVEKTWALTSEEIFSLAATLFGASALRAVKQHLPTLSQPPYNIPKKDVLDIAKNYGGRAALPAIKNYLDEHLSKPKSQWPLSLDQVIELTKVPSGAVALRNALKTFKSG